MTKNADKSIQTFKTRFVLGLCSTDNGFPQQLWDQIVPRATMTLNLPHPSRLHPQLSFNWHLWVEHKFNVNPLDPLGMKSVAHIKPKYRIS